MHVILRLSLLHVASINFIGMSSLTRQYPYHTILLVSAREVERVLVGPNWPLHFNSTRCTVSES